ncbi:MAG: phytanoyl-CoA dioxygenase family protein [Gemmatimonadota bacterium]
MSTSIATGPVSATSVDSLYDALDTDGIVIVPDAIPSEQLTAMQHAFDSRLKRLRWNTVDGYFQTEKFRHMVGDVLTLDQGFLDVALHPTIVAILDRYLEAGYELTEAKGWKSLPTRKEFHGWHGDAWYDQATAAQIHREVKLALYLTDVTSGFFEYYKGSHRQQHPRSVDAKEMVGVPDSKIAKMAGKAGTVFLFDTSGIHRQSVPILEDRKACFYNYHHPAVRIQMEDVQAYRYHPLILNASFLGGLSPKQQGMLGFGNKTNFIPAYATEDAHPRLHDSFSAIYSTQLKFYYATRKIRWRLARLTGGK